MHALAVFAHPHRNSYSGALLDAVVEGMTGGDGQTVEVADLYREGFDP